MNTTGACKDTDMVRPRNNILSMACLYLTIAGCKLLRKQATK